MFSLSRSIKVVYFFGLAAVVLLLARPQPASAQRTRMCAPALSMVGGLYERGPMMQANMQIQMAGSNGMLGMGGFSGGIGGIGGGIGGGLRGIGGGIGGIGGD